MPLPFHHHQHHPTFTPTLFATLHGHKKEVQSVAWSPDSSLLASGGEDNTTCVWNLASPEPLARLHGGADGYMWGLAWSPDGRLLAYGTGSTNFWEAVTGTHLRPLEQPNHANVAALAWSPDGRAIAASDDEASICLWDVSFGSQLALLKDEPLKDDEKPIFAVAWSPDGRLLAASTMGGVRLWDVQTGQVAATLPAKFENEVPQSIAWSPDGRYLAAQGAGPKALWVYDRTTGKQLHERWECEPYLHHMHVAWSPDGAFLATGAPFEQNIGLWDVQQGKLLCAFQRSDVGTNDLAWSPNGQYVAIASANRRVEVWALR